LGILKKIAGLFSGFFGIGFMVLAAITLLPAAARNPNMLDYYSVCSFAPVSSIILFAFAIIFMLLGLRMFKSSSAQKKALPRPTRIIAR
jgi:hypothetical protein